MKRIEKKRYSEEIICNIFDYIKDGRSPIEYLCKFFNENVQQMGLNGEPQSGESLCPIEEIKRNNPDSEGEEFAPEMCLPCMLALKEWLLEEVDEVNNPCNTNWDIVPVDTPVLVSDTSCDLYSLIKDGKKRHFNSYDPTVPYPFEVFANGTTSFSSKDDSTKTTAYKYAVLAKGEDIEKYKIKKDYIAEVINKNLEKSEEDEK